MNVAELMEMIATRQGEVSNERYARNFDISGSTLFRWRKGERTPNLETIRSMAKYFKQVGDAEMLDALAAYALFGKDSLS
jgi:hypothetical protein